MRYAFPTFTSTSTIYETVFIKNDIFLLKGEKGLTKLFATMFFKEIFCLAASTVAKDLRNFYAVFIARESGNPSMR